MNKITIFRNDQQLNLYVDKNKSDKVQINIVNPTNSTHSMVVMFSVPDKALLDKTAELEQAVLSWDQLDAAIESAAKIFQNIPVDSE
jgi:hypothetical protein